MKPSASTGLLCTTSSGMAVSHAAMVASCRSRCNAGTASSARSAARSMSPAATACRTAADRFTRLVVPPAGAAVEVCDLLGPPVEEVGSQDLREQVVVAVPAAGAVQRDEEQVGAVQVLEHVLAARCCR